MQRYLKKQDVSFHTTYNLHMKGATIEIFNKILNVNV